MRPTDKLNLLVTCWLLFKFVVNSSGSKRASTWELLLSIKLPKPVYVETNLGGGGGGVGYLDIIHTGTYIRYFWAKMIYIRYFWLSLIPLGKNILKIDVYLIFLGQNVLAEFDTFGSKNIFKN